MTSAAAPPPEPGPEPGLEAAPDAEPGTEPVTPAELVAGVRAARRGVDDHELQVFTLGLAWCDAHPVVAGEDVWHAAKRAALDAAPTPWVEDRGHASIEDLEWFGLPEIAWDAPAGFAAANAMSTLGGKAYLRDALVLRHRLPLLYRRVMAGLVPIWRARRVAAAVLGEPADVVAAVDAAVAGLAESLGPIQLDRIVEGIRLELHAEEVELAAEAARLARYARLDTRSTGADGIGSMEIRADLPDLSDFDHALSRVAAAIAAAEGDACTDPLDVRRARAVGVLADPATALALLAADQDTTDTADGTDDTDDTDDADSTRNAGAGEPREKAPARRVELVVHLSAKAVESLLAARRTDLDLGLGVPEPFGPVTHPAQDTEAGPYGRAFLTGVVREWCGRPGTHVTVRPVLDLAEEVTTDGYRPTTRQTRQARYRDRHCIFPRCTRPARSCDTDHLDPYQFGPRDGTGGDTGTGPPGQTTTTNLGPACRHHHRLKTHAGWRVRALAPGLYLWRDPHGQVFLRCPDGTTHDLTDTPTEDQAEDHAA